MQARASVLSSSSGIGNRRRSSSELPAARRATPPRRRCGRRRSGTRPVTTRGTAASRCRAIASKTGWTSVWDWLDHAEDLAGRRLPLQRLGEVLVARAQLVEQPRVLDRDHRLVGEDLEHRDVPVRRTARGAPARPRWSPIACPFAQHRQGHDTAQPGEPRRVPRGLRPLGVRLHASRSTSRWRSSTARSSVRLPAQRPEQRVVGRAPAGFMSQRPTWWTIPSSTR